MRRLPDRMATMLAARLKGTRAAAAQSRRRSAMGRPEWRQRRRPATDVESRAGHSTRRSAKGRGGDAGLNRRRNRGHGHHAAGGRRAAARGARGQPGPALELEHEHERARRCPVSHGQTAKPSEEYVYSKIALLHSFFDCPGVRPFERERCASASCRRAACRHDGHGRACCDSRGHCQLARAYCRPHWRADSWRNCHHHHIGGEGRDYDDGGCERRLPGERSRSRQLHRAGHLCGLRSFCDAGHSTCRRPGQARGHFHGHGGSSSRAWWSPTRRPRSTWRRAATPAPSSSRARIWTRLSDDPDELSNELTALAGPSAGPNGGQIYIDGFSGGQLPPKSAIREIRINQNPFSAEFDKLGYGRIEILTKPGTDKLHGQFFMQGNDDAFNTGNPFITHLPTYHTIQFNGTMSGSLSKTASFFVSAEQRNIQNISLAYGLHMAPATSGILNPHTRTNIAPRIDLQLGEKNTLTLRYQFYRDSESGELSAAQQSSSQAHEFDFHREHRSTERFVCHQRSHRQRDPLPVSSRHFFDDSGKRSAPGIGAGLLYRRRRIGKSDQRPPGPFGAVEHYYNDRGRPRHQVWNAAARQSRRQLDGRKLQRDVHLRLGSGLQRRARPAERYALPNNDSCNDLRAGPVKLRQRRPKSLEPTPSTRRSSCKTTGSSIPI